MDIIPIFISYNDQPVSLYCTNAWYGAKYTGNYITNVYVHIYFAFIPQQNYLQVTVQYFL